MAQLNMGQFEVHTNDLLGQGGFGRVYRGRDTTTGMILAVKEIDCKQVSREKILLEVWSCPNTSPDPDPDSNPKPNSPNPNQVQIMELVTGHPSFIAILGAQELTSGEIYIFMELAAGELFGRVTGSGKLEEGDAKRYLAEIMNGVEFLHGQGVRHRDLKLENVLLTGDDRCKLCDFGLAHAYPREPNGEVRTPRTPLTVLCGSKSYAAPEVLAGLGYDGPSVDVWSCGICLFAMVAGFFPLEEAAPSDWRYATAREAVGQGGSITQCIFGLYSRPCPLSPELVYLIDQLLSPRPEQRPDAAEALRSMWVVGGQLTAEVREAVLRSGAASVAKVPARESQAFDPAASPMGVVSFRQQDSSLPMSYEYPQLGQRSSLGARGGYEFGAHPSFAGSAGEGPVYRRMTMPDAAEPALPPVYRRFSSLTMPDVAASPDSMMMPKLAKQNAFYSSKHDDDAAPAQDRPRCSRRA